MAASEAARSRGGGAWAPLRLPWLRASRSHPGASPVNLDRSTLVEAARVCACFNLRRASRAVTRLYDEVLAPGGLRATAFVALVLAHAEGQPTLPRLARALGIDRSTLTRNIKPLERDGLVQVTVAKGSRTSTISLTSKGEKALVRCVPLWKEAQTRFESRVGAERWAAMLKDLSAVVSSVPEA
jgi:DNA-binding MarR family transcriptional regulator